MLADNIIAQLWICEAHIILRLLGIQLLVMHCQLLLLREIFLQLLGLDFRNQLLLI